MRRDLQLAAILVLTLLGASMALAANDPGHDTLYVLRLGDTNITGSINLTGNVTAQLVRVSSRFFGDNLDIRADGSATTAQNFIKATATDLEIGSGAKIILNGGGTVVQVGTVAAPANLNVTGNIYDSNARVCTASNGLCGGTGGTGNVSSSTAGTDNAVVRYDGATGRTVQRSVVTISDGGNFAGVGNISTNTILSIGNGASASADDALAVGSSTTASAASATALGHYATASAIESVAIGFSSYAPNGRVVAIGSSASGYANDSIAIGFGAWAYGTNSTTIGSFSRTNHNNSIALGAYAVTTAANQLMIGNRSSWTQLNVQVNGILNTTDNLYENNARVCTATNGICASTGDNTSWNQALADTLYYGISNPWGYYNSSTIPSYATSASLTAETNQRVGNDSLLYPRTNPWGFYNSSTLPAQSTPYQSSAAGWVNSTGLVRTTNTSDNVSIGAASANAKLYVNAEYGSGNSTGLNLLYNETGGADQLSASHTGLRVSTESNAQVSREGSMDFTGADIDVIFNSAIDDGATAESIIITGLSTSVNTTQNSSDGNDNYFVYGNTISITGNIGTSLNEGWKYGVLTSVRGTSPYNVGGSFSAYDGAESIGIQGSATNGAYAKGGSFGASGATNNYGIEIISPSAGANNYAIYSSATAKSYFAGNVGIGTTSPYATLQVAGTINSSGNLYENNVRVCTATNGLCASGGGNQAAGWTNTSTTIYTTDTNDNVAIGATSATQKLSVTGSANISGAAIIQGVTFDPTTHYDDNILFAPQAYIEEESLPTTVAGSAFTSNVDGYATYNTSDIPFSKVLLSTTSDTIYSDYIPVTPGETLYGEMWAMRESGAAGTAGTLYFGIERYDKDKMPVAANQGTVYAFASAATVPTTGVWTKYSGTSVIPATHTPYLGSDGGPVRYVRVRIITNYNVGTIPTYWGGIILARERIARHNGTAEIPGTLTVGSGTQNYATLPGELYVQNDLEVDGTIYGAGTGLTGTAASLTAGAATALAANPADCAANTWATTIAASGALTCSAVTYAGITAMTSANFATIISDESGTGNIMFNSSPIMTTPTWAGTATGSISGNAGDLSCTDCIGATEISDVYLLNSGDTATGNYTFDTNTLHIDSTGNLIGIGTTTPARLVHLVSSASTSTGLRIDSNGASGQNFSIVSTNSGSSLGGGRFVIWDEDNSAARFTINGTSGYVGIGMTDPTMPLDVNGVGRFQTGVLINRSDNAYILFYDDSVAVGKLYAPTANSFAFANGTGGAVVLTMDLMNGNVAIGSDGGTYATGLGDLYITSDLEVDGNIYGSLADLAENIPVTEAGLEPGDIVEFDPESSVSVRKARGPYSTLAAGIISTAPGITLSKETAGVPLAIAGRVPVKANDENGPIMTGDLLTTSSTPGEAMACRDAQQCFGAVIGKAAEPLNGTSGMVTALVMLG